MTKELLLAACRAEASTGEKFNVVLDLDEVDGMCVVSALQLALRHPKYKTTPSANRVAKLVEFMIEQCPSDRPALKELLEAGIIRGWIARRMKSLPDKIAVLERHVAMLKRVLPNLVARAELDKAAADHEIETLEELLNDLRRYQNQPSFLI